MDKRKLERDLKKFNNGALFMSAEKVGMAMGYGKGTTRELLKGMDAVQSGSRKKFFIPDIAERISERVIR